MRITSLSGMIDAYVAPAFLVEKERIMSFDERSPCLSSKFPLMRKLSSNKAFLLGS
jgi:hypothetical protein